MIILQKQPSEVFRIKTVLEHFAIFRTTPVSNSLFNKVAGLKACNFIKKRLQHSYFLVNIAKFFKTPILKNICEQLLLVLCPTNNQTAKQSS